MIATLAHDPEIDRLNSLMPNRNPSTSFRFFRSLCSLGFLTASAAQASHDKLSATISGQSLLPPQVFTSLLAKIYKRKK